MPEAGSHIHKGHRSRLRQRFLTQGLEGFLPHEALELLLFYAIPQADTNPLAHRLIQTFGSLDAVFSAHPEELMQVPGVGENTAVLISLLKPIANLAARNKTNTPPVLENKRDLENYCLSLPFDLGHETFYLICLDAQWRVLRTVPLFQGTIDAVSIHARIIVETALRHKAYSVVAVHNHPSEKAEPSQADMQVTELIYSALDMVEIPLIDHIIVSGGRTISIRNYMNSERKIISIEEKSRQAADQNNRRRKPSTLNDFYFDEE